MKKIMNTDFFTQKGNSTAVSAAPDTQSEAIEMPEEAVKPESAAVPAEAAKQYQNNIRMDQAFRTMLKEAETALLAAEQKTLAQEIHSIGKETIRERFSIAVVGEFSRGKSTFINHFVHKPILPVADLPTTAMLTRIRPHSSESMVYFDEKGKRVGSLPLHPSSWKNLTADNFNGKDPKGTVLVGLKNPWMEANNVELIDTPGAGDLEKSRAQRIGDALLGSDGAIIVVSAAAALSQSEKLFIEQRLLAHKTPFLMLIITKLDQVKLEERNHVIAYVMNKLKSWKMEISVFVPYAVELTDDTYASIVGMNPIRAEIEKWLADPKRNQLTREWLKARAETIIDDGMQVLQERQTLLDADDDKRKALIEHKKSQLDNASIIWEDLRIKMLSRCNACYQVMTDKVNEYQTNMIERLQYEAGHANVPQKWWREDYPYRLKMEMTNLSINVENLVTRKISEDILWLNTSLDKQFRANVHASKQAIADKDDYSDLSKKKLEELNNQDLRKMQNITRIGTTAVSIAGAIALGMAGLGYLSIIATMGVGAGGGIVGNEIFSRKLDKQRDVLKKAVADDVPKRIEIATAQSEQRLLDVYEAIIDDAKDTEQKWKTVQNELIENSADPKNTEAKQQVLQQIDKLKQISMQIKVNHKEA